jgi:hypothetical protein
MKRTSAQASCLVGFLVGCAPAWAQTEVGLSPTIGANVERAAPGGAIVSEAAVAVPGEWSEVLYDHADNGDLWAVGQTWKARFTAEGMTFVPFFGSDAPRNFPLSFQVANASVGAVELKLGDALPVREGSRVVTERGGLSEVVDLRLDMVEQSFVFRELPERGEVSVELKVAGDFECRAVDDGIEFVNAHGAVGYQKAVAVDARKRRLELPITWQSGVVSLRIPADFVAAAELPLVLDPVVRVTSSVSPNTTLTQSVDDVATLPGAGRTCVVTTRQFSQNDNDMFVHRLDPALLRVPNDTVIDSTFENWISGAVAASPYANKFLVVASRRVGEVASIAGCFVMPDGATSSRFDIELPTTTAPGSKTFPDVGADPFPGPNSYFTVVWMSRLGRNSDIYYRQLQQNGAPRTASSILLAGSSDPEILPAISKSCGRVSGALPTHWHVVWSRLVPFGSQVWGAQIGWNGNIARAPTPLVSSGDPAVPDVSSWADIDGQRFSLVTCAVKSNGQSDIVCAAVDTNGAVRGQFNLNATSNGGAFQSLDQPDADVDSDGARFVVTYYQGAVPADVRAAVVAFLPQTSSFRIEDSNLPIAVSSGDETTPYIAADFSGGGPGSPRFVTVATNTTTNQILAAEVLGHSAAGGFANRGPSCGLTLTATGVPALGSTVTFQVPNNGLSGITVGAPGTIFIFGCQCIQGVLGGTNFGPTHTMTIGTSPSLVGMVMSVQGWSQTGGSCWGVARSQTIDMTIQ